LEMSKIMRRCIDGRVQAVWWCQRARGLISECECDPELVRVSERDANANVSEVRQSHKW